ncbi:DUF1697 domain-containing protein [Jatrophihabitans telluris]|uniref:DUF1697 domain-containing protein n=1 Tax=Jatrophihabitans telluris TaxID=2038343 RepID=A0ABY4R087_9ACTN|nr:DUF1697 domain-containing protein [Jatrophihabitans telluris]UQX88479.1 DUF1697 domain-containing protein [Jatrophihabitans telluris]
MTVFIGLLRGINVGGHATLPMADLRRIAGQAGLSDVKTYIQSGNLVFTSSRRDEQGLADDLTAAIKADAGIEPAVVLRTLAHWQQAISSNPYAVGAVDPKSLHVCFFADTPPNDVLDGIELSAYEPEAAQVVGRQLYYFLPNGLGRSKLAADLSRRKPIKAGTVRNWRTVQKLAELAHELR